MIKIADKNDIETLINITENSRAILGYPDSFVPLFRNYLTDIFYNKHVLEERITLIYYINNIANGYISFSIDIDKNEVEILNLFVISANQKNGVGSVLLKTCENISQKFGVKKIKLASEPKSINFYFKHNYFKTDEILKSAVLPDITYPYVVKYF